MTTLRRPRPGTATGGVAHPVAITNDIDPTTPTTVRSAFGMRPPDVRETGRISAVNPGCLSGEARGTLRTVDDLDGVVDRRRDVGDRDRVGLPGLRRPPHRIEPDR